MLLCVWQTDGLAMTTAYHCKYNGRHERSVIYLDYYDITFVWTRSIHKPVAKHSALLDPVLLL